MSATADPMEPTAPARQRRTPQPLSVSAAGARTVTTPIGDVQLCGVPGGLTSLQLPGHHDTIARPPSAEPADVRDLLDEAERQLLAYFAGTLQTFELPLVPTGSEFQRSVWSALRTIPYGTTISYAQLAGVVGKPRAARAVGQANGANPIAIIVPCHRVIAAGGGLGGYAGGLEIKSELLAREGVLAPRR